MQLSTHKDPTKDYILIHFSFFSPWDVWKSTSRFIRAEGHVFKCLQLSRTQRHKNMYSVIRQTKANMLTSEALLLLFRPKFLTCTHEMYLIYCLSSLKGGMFLFCSHSCSSEDEPCRVLLCFHPDGFPSGALQSNQSLLRVVPFSPLETNHFFKPPISSLQCSGWSCVTILAFLTLMIYLEK